MAEKTKKLTPPYTTYASFINLLNDLREAGVPTHISRSVVKGSNSGKATMISSLKSMGLIENDSQSTGKLSTLVDSEGEDFKEAFKEIIEQTYPFLFDGTVDLANTTTEIVAQKFKDAGASGSTVSKGVAFFLTAAKECGIPISSRVKAPTPTRNGGSRKPKKASPKPEEQQDDYEGEAFEFDAIPEGMIKITIPLHGMKDGILYLPEGMTKKQWAYAKKMAAFILSNYHEEFEEEDSNQ